MTCSEYKDSGIEWIGEIPNRWDLIQIKNLFTERTEKNSGGNTNYLSIVKDVGVVLYADKGNVGNKTSDNPENYKMVYVDDLVINPMNLIIGSVGVSRYNGCLSSVYIVLVLSPNSCSVSSYYGYIFSHKIFQAHLKKICYGIMELRESLNKIEFNVEKLPYPPLQEQQQIANFLDYKTQQLDSLIEKTQQKIELLKEQRTALINQVVTRGLCSDVETKDSGFEWIGEIPVGWRVGKVYQYGDVLSGATPSRDKPEYWDSKDIPWMSSGEINQQVITRIDACISTLGYENSSVSILPKHTVMIGLNGQGKTKGTAGILELETTCNQSLCGIITNEFIVPYYMFRYLDSQYFHLRGLVGEGKREGISAAFLKRYPILIPPIQEQKQIVEYLDSKTQQIDSQVEKETKRIELLKEYRNALISEVVTGKIDVREEMVA